jgi:class 3 adenylate cyclase
MLTSPFVAGMKATVMIGTGLITGAVSLFSRGLLLRSLEEQRQKESAQRLFGQYVGGVVSERILGQAAESRGERVEVVVLFSDLRGFSSFAEGRDPAEVVDRLNAYFERMVDAINQQRGVVDKFIGDAIMAIFGGIVPLENPCEAAVRAALGMREALGELNAEWTEQGIEAFDNGIGLHLGEVLQGPIGSRDRKEFTAIGDAVNSAARLEGLTKDNETSILITAAVYERLSADLRAGFNPLGDVSVKGKREMLVIYGWGVEAL